MKNVSVVLSSLALVGVIVLFVLFFNSNKSGKSTGLTLPKDLPASAGGNIAYVDIDTLEAHYDYLKNKKADFEKRQQQLDAELSRSMQQLQNEYIDLQKRAQSGTISQSEGEAIQKRLLQGQQSLETRKQSVTEQLLKERDEFNEEIHSRLDSFLTEYNKDKGYSFILSYTRAGQIMYADKALNITQEVITGMNSLAEPVNKADTTKKK